MPSDYRRHKRPRPKKRRKEVIVPKLADFVDLTTYTHIVGVDEVGWGALAGPLTVGGVLLPVGAEPTIKDSKRYTTDRARRRAWDALVLSLDPKHTIQQLDPCDVDSMGHGPALRWLTREVASVLLTAARYEGFTPLLVLDGECSFQLPEPAISIPKADGFVHAVSAASVVAKLSRDEYMCGYNDSLHDWELYKNKGYGTKSHIKMLKERGPIPFVHRKSSTFNFTVD